MSAVNIGKIRHHKRHTRLDLRLAKQGRLYASGNKGVHILIRAIWMDNIANVFGQRVHTWRRGRGKLALPPTLTALSG